MIEEMTYTFLTSYGALTGLARLVSSFVAWLITSLKSPFIYFSIMSLKAGSLRAAQKSLDLTIGSSKAPFDFPQS